MFQMNCLCFDFFKKEDVSNSDDLHAYTASKKIKLFIYEELLHATNSFHPDNKIGRGGFGSVFKGTLRKGKPIAVKVLAARSKQGIEEFLAEIDTIANIKHSNLVELIGCCIEGDKRILVYEFLELGSLDDALLAQECRTMFDWSKRSAVCIGAAAGLAFLHEDVEPNIIHRDIKASNILLDRDFLPKIGDFGLAKLFPDNVTHLTTRVAGTCGYLAPEYALGGRLTKKADVFSFGVLVLEIVSGSRSKPRVRDTSKFLLEQAWHLYKKEKLVEIVDPDLKEYPEEEVLKFIKIALFCTQGAAHRRPPMVQVLEMLTSTIQLHDKELTPPGLFKDAFEIEENPKANSSSGSQPKVSWDNIKHCSASDHASDFISC